MDFLLPIIIVLALCGGIFFAITRKRSSAGKNMVSATLNQVRSISPSTRTNKLLDSAKANAASAKQKAAISYVKLTNRPELNASFEQELEIEMMMLPSTISDGLMARYRDLLVKYGEANAAYLTYDNEREAADNSNLTSAQWQIIATKYLQLTSQLNSVDIALTKLLRNVRELNGKISDEELVSRRKVILAKLDADRSVLDKITIFNTDNYRHALDDLSRRVSSVAAQSSDNWKMHEALESLKAEQVALSSSIHDLPDIQQQIQEAIRYHLPKKLALAKQLVGSSVVANVRKGDLSSRLEQAEKDIVTIKTNTTLNPEELLQLKDSVSRSLDDIARAYNPSSASRRTKR